MSRRDNQIAAAAKPARTAVRREMENVARGIANGLNARLRSETRARIRRDLEASTRDRLGDYADTDAGEDFLSQRAKIRSQALSNLDSRIKARVAETQLAGDRQEWSDAKTKRELKSTLGDLGVLASEQLSSNEAVQDENFVLSQEAEETEMEMEWIAANDFSVRPSHARMDGERIKPGERFSNGLAYPGDIFGDPVETVNCRCTIRLVSPRRGK